jgi:hypothetical protein
MKRSRAAGCWPGTKTAGPASCAWLSGTFITAVYYPGENQIYTVLQQGDHFEKQEQKFSVVPIGATSLLTVDLDVETKLPFPKPMVKKAIGDTLDYLADNLKNRAEQLAARS